MARLHQSEGRTGVAGKIRRSRECRSIDSSLVPPRRTGAPYLARFSGDVGHPSFVWEPATDPCSQLRGGERVVASIVGLPQRRWRHFPTEVKWVRVRLDFVT